MYGASDSRLHQSGSQRKAGKRPGLRHALAGLHAGVLGATVMLACVMLGSLWYGRSIWLVPNLFATTFFGSGVYRNQLLRTSWAGIALIVAIYGALGTIWGCIWRDERRPWMAVYGAIAGLAIYFLFNDFLWRHLNPLITLYAPDRQLQIGHVLWGMVLARSPVYARRISDSTVVPVAQQPGRQHGDQDTGNQDNEVPEVRSGEVIL